MSLKSGNVFSKVPLIEIICLGAGLMDLFIALRPLWAWLKTYLRFIDALFMPKANWLCGYLQSTVEPAHQF